MTKKVFTRLKEENEGFNVPESAIIKGSQLKDLTNKELLHYYEKLERWISKGWKHEGRYILQDYTRYEILNRMEGVNNND
ncbi:hypothetical protein BCB4_0069 [Bacillus phage B4]|uniref:Uncharacterized protein n=2 Tax=Bequatrovirus B4 TaxID=1918005 RepID=J9Q955_9CAUD|nr:hypothetical protein BCB4_0069 [Bacillus phage B4]YP_009783663.1 hypothetical protein QLX26_gp067 [Bacillus phage B5S]MEB9013923.1 hypothetical protein [Bacillus cereus]AEW47301.1 hypothetical protein B5S_0067 [Bacillus phage B5S]AEZ65862.1 hypothetical protein BCB4_0069 [Bacillus phage B4]MEB9190464.1 hypothetical protein [Bacillus cereus]